MNYTTGDRNPIYISSKQLQKPLKKDKELIKILDYLDKHTAYDPIKGVYHLPPMKEVKE